MSDLKYPHRAIAIIYESIDPIVRGRKYCDPLDHALQSAAVGAVEGEGTQLNAAREIEFVDIEVGLADLDRALELTRETLKRCGAPAGSLITFPKDGEMVSVTIDSGAPVADRAVGQAAAARRLLGASPAAVPQYAPEVVASAAQKTLASYRTLFADSYHHFPVDPTAYDPALLAWYDDVSATMTHVGFAVLGDLSVTPDPARRPARGAPFARRLLAADGRHRMDIFQIRNAKTGATTSAMNIVTEFPDGRFVWTSTSPKRWNTPDHVDLDYLDAHTDASSMWELHMARQARYAADPGGTLPVTMRSLDDVLASEGRCQSATAAFRRAQAVPTLEELLRLNTEPALAAAVHAEMRRMVFGEPPPGQTSAPAHAPVAASQWQVTTIEFPAAASGPMAFDRLVQFALDQGTAQVEKVGSPLNPFLVLDTGHAFFFVCQSGDPDPMQIALENLRAHGGRAGACALVMDTRIGMKDGTKTDAIVVMASRRDGGNGQTWAQGYRPKGFLRAFRKLELREQVGECANLFDALKS